MMDPTARINQNGAPAWNYRLNPIQKKFQMKFHQMNHATARNVFLSALRKIAKPVHDLHGKPNTYDDLQKTAKDPRFQSGVAEILESINTKDKRRF